MVFNRVGEVVGYTICDDMTSRSIEGENPLYLPQAKIYPGACARRPRDHGRRGRSPIRSAHHRADHPPRRRGGLGGSVSTATLRRRVDELAGYLFREDDFPLRGGAVDGNERGA